MVGAEILADALLLFSVAAVGGIVMAVFVFTNRNPPIGLAIVHSGLALTALVLAVWSADMPASSPLVVYGLVLLIFAAFGGVFLTDYQLRGEPQPKLVMVVHAVIAVSGVSCFAIGLLGTVGLGPTLRLMMRWFR